MTLRDMSQNTSQQKGELKYLNIFFFLFRLTNTATTRQRAGNRCSKADLSLCKGTATRAYPVSLPRHLDTSIFSRWTQRSGEGGVHCSAVTVPSSLTATSLHCDESGRPSCVLTHLAQEVCREMILHSALSHPCPIPVIPSTQM
jgi:hypothetical protein